MKATETSIKSGALSLFLIERTLEWFSNSYDSRLDCQMKLRHILKHSTHSYPRGTLQRRVG